MTNTIIYGTWQHLLLCSGVIIISILIGSLLSFLAKKKNLFNALFKIVAIVDILVYFMFLLGFIIFSDKLGGIEGIIGGQLPFFFCSTIHFAFLISLFARGKLKQAMIDYIFLIGPLVAVAGTFLAGNYFTDTCLLWTTIWNTIMHAVGAIGATYLICSRQVKLNQNMWIPYVFIGALSIVAFSINYMFKALDIAHPNYMFFNSPDGTPFVIFFNLVENVKIGEFELGKKVLYPIIVFVCQMLYVAIFHLCSILIHRLAKKENKTEENNVVV